MTLVLLPGLDGTGKLFLPLLKLLPKELDVIVISYPKNILLSYEELTKRVYNKLPNNKPYIILAESFSGIIAYNIAKRKPNNLKTIIFVGTFLQNPRPFLLNKLSLLILRVLLYIPIPIFIAKYLFFEEKENSYIVKKFKKIINNISPKILGSRLKEILRNNMPLESLDMNTYYIAGIYDKLVPLSVLKTFLKIFKSVTIYSIPTGHLILQSQPERCCNIIIEIIEKKNR